MDKTLNFSKTSKYTGEIESGKLNGKGTYIGTYSEAKNFGLNLPDYKIGTPEQLIIVGEFKDDKPHGQGTYTDTTGKKYSGKWKDGEFLG
ncbi:hypothetical protein OAH53_02805 [Candidatus Pelagibacter sp.]|nr:hypothetical protein [Candidatus Pelagibacter sp.]